MAETKAARILKCATILETMPDGLSREELEAWMLSNVATYTFREMKFAMAVVEFIEEVVGD